jgi:pimeloyl-ACP methyl ester carboxylesterase
MVVGSVPLHYLVRRGRGPDPLPLLLCHGWPWTFWDWGETIDALADPAAAGGDDADAFDVVVPSLPGFAFSTPQRAEIMGYGQMADVLAELMTDVLGYDRFGAVGGDIGNMITGVLGHTYVDRLCGIHLLGALPPSGYTGTGPRGPDFGLEPPRQQPTDPVLLVPPRALRLGPTLTSTSAHMLVHAVEPQTIAAAMHDSPAGLLAYLLHRRYWWSHNDGDVLQAFTPEFILTNVSLYWFTDCFASSVRTYHDMIFHPWRPVHDRRPVVEAPTGITFFTHDLTSQNRIWCGEYYNLVRTSEREGGHFAPAEVPATVVEEIRETFRLLRRRP